MVEKGRNDLNLGPKRPAGPKRPRILGPNRLFLRAEKVRGPKRPASDNSDAHNSIGKVFY